VTINCALWALAQIAGIPAGEMVELLRPYADHDPPWVGFDAAGRIASGVIMPELAVDLMPGLGFRVASYKGTGPLIASGWARWSSRWFPGAAILLIVDTDVPGGHVVIAKDGLILDNQNPAGLLGPNHPYADARVRVILRFDDGADMRRWVVVAEPAAQEASAGRTGAILAG
jgi:hypothetical protein